MHGLLAYTGAGIDVPLLLGSAGLLLVIGIALVLWRRWRRRIGRRRWWMTVAGMGLTVLLLGSVLGSSPRAAEAAETCGLEVSNVSTSGVQPLLPGQSQRVDADLTNSSALPIAVFLRSAVTSDPVGLAEYASWRAEGRATVVGSTLRDPEFRKFLIVKPGEQVRVRIGVSISTLATNQYQAAPVTYRLLARAMQVG